MSTGSKLPPDHPVIRAEEAEARYEELRSKLKAEVERLREGIEAGKSGTELMEKLGWDDLATRNRAMGARATIIADRLQAILSDVEGGER